MADDQRRRSGGAGLLLTAALLGVGYVLSPVPVGWLLEDAPRPEWVESAIGVFYAPLQFLYDHFAWVERFYDWQVEFID